MIGFIICAVMALLNLPGALVGNPLSIASMGFCSAMALVCLFLAARN